MLSRRQVLYGGLGALAAGLAPGGGRLASVFASSVRRLGGGDPSSTPILPLPFDLESVEVGGWPFSSIMTGDPFPDPHARILNGGPYFPPDRPPRPTEHVKIAVVGGGISGLGAGYLLRDHDPVILELGARFGGSARGEEWGDVPYSLGGAYVITPDPGSFLHHLYRRLKLQRDHRLDDGLMEVELDGDILREEFWTGEGRPKEERAAFERYAEVVEFMAQESYPEIPLPGGKEADWIIDLDRKTFRADIVERMGMDVPPVLAAAIQAYCYSSFGAGWEEISAASGWNFLAAEEFGRWVFDGGNAQMALRLWEAIAENENASLRAGALVLDVRLRFGGVQLTWLDPDDRVHSLLADRVVMACPKNVARRVLVDAERLDPEKFHAMHSLAYRGYVVANVLLDAPIERDFYDIFLLGDGKSFPMNEAEAEANSRVVDVLSGHFARGRRPGPRSVLTLYWPLPWGFGQHTLLNGKATWRDYAERLAPQIDPMLELLDVPAEAVKQIRMTYFGHGMPIAYPGFIAQGTAEAVRRPFEGKVFFVQQDNWALPAVENCLLDAEHFAPQIAAGL